MGRKSYSKDLPSMPAPDFQGETEQPSEPEPKAGAEYYTLSRVVDADLGTDESKWDGPFSSKRSAGKSLADAGIEGIILRKVGAVVFEVVRKARVS